MKTMLRATVATLPLLLATAALAQQQTFNINPDSSKVSFTLASHDTVQGDFHVEKGAIVFDRSAATIAGEVVVAAGSGKTGNDSRDKKMTTQILDAPHFADATFAPKSYKGTIAASGDSAIEVSGVFTLHGTAHDLTVPMQLHIDGVKCTASTHFVVPYVQWGLKDPSIMILKVAKQVDVTATFVGFIAAN